MPEVRPLLLSLSALRLLHTCRAGHSSLVISTLFKSLASNVCILVNVSHRGAEIARSPTELAG